MTRYLIAGFIVLWAIIHFVEDKKVKYIGGAFVSLVMIFIIYSCQVYISGNIEYLEKISTEHYNCVYDLDINDTHSNFVCNVNHMKGLEYYVENMR